MNQVKRSLLKPALIGGVAEGVAGSIPILNLVNCAFGIMVIGGGFLAAYIYMKDAPPSAKAPLGSGVKLGLLTGLFGAVTFCLISIPLAMLIPDLAATGVSPLENIDLPPKIAEALTIPVILAMFFGLISFVFDPIFCTIGSLIGVTVFNKKPLDTQSPTRNPQNANNNTEADKEENEANNKEPS